jgi:hypothetical protein
MIYFLIAIIILQFALIAFLWYTTSRIINKAIETSEKLEENIKIFEENEKRIGDILEIELFSDEPYVMEFISLIKNTKLHINKTIQDLSFYEEEN